MLTLAALGGLWGAGCGSGEQTVTVTTEGRSEIDSGLRACLLAAYRPDDGNTTTGDPQARAADCLGLEEAIVQESPLLNACLAVATELRDPGRFARRVEKCRRAFENSAAGPSASP